MERRGLPTVVVGVMLDIMQVNRPPRAAFVDFPLGHPFGRPNDQAGQRAILKDVLRLLETAPAAGSLARLPYAWGEDFAYVPGQRKHAPQEEE